MSHRQEQLESSLQKAIGLLLSEGLSDPRVRGLISVTQVKLSPDSRHANVSVSVLPAEFSELTLHGLRAASGHIRSRLDGKLKTRTTPLLHFELDDSLKKQAAVLNAIQQATPTADPGDDVDAKGVKP